MRKAFRFWPVAVIVIAVAMPGVAIWWAAPPKEPVYQNQPLHYWLSAYDWSYHDPSKPENPSRPTKDAADLAMRKIGTNAIPTLLRMLNERDSSLKERLYGMLRRQRFYKIDLPYHPGASDAHEAMMAFDTLGPQSGNLMPQLEKIYDRNPNPRSRQMIIMIATSCEPNAPETVPLFLRALADTNDFILRGDGAVGLGKIHAPADVAVPELTKALADSEDMVRFMAAESLATYGAEAQTALPALIKLIETEKAKTNSATLHAAPTFPSGLAWGFCSGDATSLKRNQNKFYTPFACDPYGAAKKALWKIDPDAAEQAGLKQSDSEFFQQWRPLKKPVN